MGDERANIVYLAAPDELKTEEKRRSRWCTAKGSRSGKTCEGHGRGSPKVR